MDSKDNNIAGFTAMEEETRPGGGVVAPESNSNACGDGDAGMDLCCSQEMEYEKDETDGDGHKEDNSNKNDKEELQKKETLRLRFIPSYDSLAGVPEGVPAGLKKLKIVVNLRACDFPRKEENDNNSDEAGRAPVDIVVALDNSGSMCGEKIQGCKDTLVQMVRYLGSDDRFSLVTFSDDVKVIFPLIFMTKENKEMVLHKIASVHADGLTNLSGGLEAAAEELAKAKDPNLVRSIFLLTDGHPNVGIEKTEDLVFMVSGLNSQQEEQEQEDEEEDKQQTQDEAAETAQQAVVSPSPPPSKKAKRSSLRKSIVSLITGKSKKSRSSSSLSSSSSSWSFLPRGARFPTTAPSDENKKQLASAPADKPISLFCFGYGSDHNSEMLKQISAATPGGGYYFVEKDSDVATAFGDAMGGLLSVVAQSVTISISIPPPGEATSNGVQISEVYHKQAICRGGGAGAGNDDGSNNPALPMYYTVHVGDFYAEEERDVLFEVTIPVSAAGASIGGIENQKDDSKNCLRLVDVGVSFMDTLQKCPSRLGPVSCSIPLSYSSTTESEESTQKDIVAPNEHVEVQWLRIQTIQAMEDANALGGNSSSGSGLAEARKILKAAKASILDSFVFKKYNMAPPPADDDSNAMRTRSLLRALMGDLDSLMDSFESMEEYTTSGQHYASAISHSYTTQRCTASSSTAYSPFRTSHKASMSSKYHTTD